MNNSLPKMLDSLPAAMFDKSPREALAIRVRNPAGLDWEVADTRLRLTLGGNVLDFDGSAEFSGAYDFGMTHREYDLSSLTLGELADALRADGNQVLFESVEMAGRSALTLLPGTNNQDRSNGDHLYAFTSLLWAILATYESEVDAAAGQIPEALRQMVMTQAEGEWLDEWAALYGVPRFVGESDPALQERIPEEVFRQRVNPLAIEKAVLDLAGESVRIDEPWRRMFALDTSVLSGAHAMPDGEYFTYHVIQPVARSAFDWSDALAVIHRHKAAGVDVYSPLVEFPVSHVTVQPPVEYLVERAGQTVHVFGAWPGGESPLGVMRLSANEFTFNHKASIYQLRTYSNAEGLQTEQYIGLPRNVAYASIALSDGVPLGDENATFSRGQIHIEYDPEPTVSDTLALSDYNVTRDVRRVELVTIDSGGYYLLWDGVTVVDNFRNELSAHSASAYDGTNFWSSLWSDRTWYGWRFVGTTITHESA